MYFAFVHCAMEVGYRRTCAKDTCEATVWVKACTSEVFPDLELKAKESVNVENVTENCDFSSCEDQRSLAIATCNVPLEIPVCSSEQVSNDITQDNNQLDCTWSEDESSVVSDTDLGIKCNNTNEDSTLDDLTEDQEDMFSNAAVLPLYEGS